MPDAKTLKTIHAVVNEAEYALAQIGENLLFQVKPEGGLAIVRRGPDGLPVEPEAMVADVASADPLLWQAARPEGDVSLGRPYRDAEPRCALTGKRLQCGTQVGLYYRGQPVDVESATAFSPRLVFLHSLMYFLGALTDETSARVPPQGEVDEAREKEGAAARALWDDFLTRLQETSVGASRAGADPDTKLGDVSEDN